MSRNMGRRFLEIISSDGYGFPTFVTSTLMLLWGMWLFCPWWDTFESAKAYTWMAAIAPEFTWGALFMFVGFMQAKYVLIRDGRGVAVSATTAAFLWAAVSVSFFIGDITNTGGIVYLSLFLYNAWVRGKLREDH